MKNKELQEIASLIEFYKDAEKLVNTSEGLNPHRRQELLDKYDELLTVQLWAYYELSKEVDNNG